MGALFGTLSALMIGFADLFVRRAAASSSALTPALTVQVTAVVASLLCVAGFGGVFTPRDLALGLLSGAALAAGFATYYDGILRSSSTIVSPLVAALSAIVPFVYTIATGARPSGYALAGAAAAIGGIVVMTLGGGRAERVRTGLLWGTVSGLAYGVAFTLVIEATGDAGSWPAVWQRVAAAITFAVLTLRAGAAPIPAAGLRFAAVLAGVCSALCTVFYLVGVRADPTAGVITASMFPAASVGVGRLFFHDPVSRLQGIGLVVVLAGVMGVVAG